MDKMIPEKPEKAIKDFIEDEVDPSLQVSAPSDQDVYYLEEKVAWYKSKGLNQKEAEAAAALDLKELKEKRTADGEKIWERLVKETRADSLLKDQITGALNAFKLEFNKKRAPETIDFKLRLETSGTHYDKKGRLTRIASAAVVLDHAYNGVWRVWRRKSIAFQHVREMRDGHNWKFELYTALFRDLFAFGLHYQMLLDGYREGRIRIPTQTNQSEGGSEADRANLSGGLSTDGTESGTNDHKEE